MNNEEIKQVDGKEMLDIVKDDISKERAKEWEQITEDYAKSFTNVENETNMNLLMPESVFVKKYLPLFAQVAVNKNTEVMGTDAWKEWMSMTIGGTREVGIVADKDLELTEDNEMISETSDFPHKYVSHSVNVNSVKVLYKVPPITAGVVTNTENISKRIKELGIPNVADTGTAIKTQMNYTEATGTALLHQALSVLGQNTYPAINDYKQRWKDIFYRYYKPKQAETAVKDTEETDKEYDELW